MKDGLSFSQLLEVTKGYTVSDIGEFVKDIERHYQLSPTFSRFVHLVSGVYVFDYIDFKYHYIDHNFARIAERPKDYILDQGLGPKEKIWYAPDQEVFTGKFLTKNLEFFKKIPENYRDKYKITCNYRNKTKEGDLKNIQQTSFVIRSTPEGIPLAVLGFVADISKTTNIKDNRLYHAIDFILPGEPQPVPNFFQACFSGKSILSKRQQEVFELICDGLGKKDVAEKLYISPKTVDNHFQAIYKITGSHNEADLLRWAILHGYR